MSNKLSEYQIGLAMGLVNEGASFHQVGREFGVSKNVVSRLRNTESIQVITIENCIYCCNQKKWTAGDAMQIKRWIYSGECSTSDLEQETY